MTFQKFVRTTSSSSSRSLCSIKPPRPRNSLGSCAVDRRRRQGGSVGGNLVACNSTKFQDLAECFSEECGITKPKEVEIVVDILTNPASGYIDRKMANKYRRFQLKELDTDVHIKPVANWLRSLGADRKQIRRIIVSYPPIIGYSVEGHLEPLVQYLQEVGVTDVISVITSRPSLLGLKAEESLRKIVEWLQFEGYSKEEIVDYLSRTV
mmetsp:Transcript_12469/g.23452  ORF Transcript_12469/g.23452 Transcript_12469/m.23452 type:complete len:209 (-) Transcript_12469:69-695(-)|eukprot:CAMPEP_0197470094 /NCGR_PEP_ID=MMETSP1309-20131121/677_1 /TAXON_ID=464262 /ORGANISM="Genus nov. species nov., Strain RCC998" /LENGTH=208 /DNA_ID=CAMNT_0043006633 /DNA_START=105 /DNA_END=731 /DNA_ORIENTATION=+